VSAVKSGELVAAISEHRNRKALQPLERVGQVEDDLGACAEDSNGCPPKLDEVGRLVLGMATMHAADAPGCEAADAGHFRGAHCRRDGGGANGAADQGRAEISGAHLDRAGGDAHNLGVGQADHDLTVQDTDRRGHCAFLSYGRLAVACRSQVVWGGEALSDYRRFERDHGAAAR